jgi:hypothetical protein
MIPNTGAAPAEEPLQARIRRILATRHRGRALGITGAALARAVGAAPRSARRAIEELRLAEGQPGAHPDTGYYWIVTAEDKALARAFLRSRAMTSLKLWSRMDGVPLENVIGQLSIDLDESEDAAPSAGLRAGCDEGLRPARITIHVPEDAR